jgi:hypothetical protein
MIDKRKADDMTDYPAYGGAKPSRREMLPEADIGSTLVLCSNADKQRWRAQYDCCRQCC